MPNHLFRRIAATTALVLFTSAALPRPAAAEPFPNLSVSGLDGGYVALSDLKGQVVLLNFWATWCGPCRMELPVIQKLYDKYNGRGLTVLSLNTDASPVPVKPFLEKMKLSLPVYRISQEDQARLGVSSIPTSFLVDASGNMIRAQPGYYPNFEQDWTKLIEDEIAKRKPKAKSPAKGSGR